MKPRFPLRRKILLLALANLAFLVISLAIFVRLQLRQEFQSFLMSAARERILSVARQLAIDLEETDASARNDLLKRYSEAQDVMFVLFDVQGQRLAGPEIPLPREVRERLVRPRLGPFAGRRSPGAATAFPAAPPFLVVADQGPRYWVGVRIAFRDRATGEFTRAVLTIVSPNLWSNPFFFQLEPWLAIAGIALLGSLLCWMPWVRGLTRTITRMMNATAEMAEGRFGIRVDTKRQDELGLLARSIEQMAFRLESYIQGQKRLLGDIAHELRSPLGRMQIGLGILERRAETEDQKYLTGLQDEVELMSKLTSELLTFARAQLSPETLQLVSVNVKDVVAKAVQTEAGGDSNIHVPVDPGLAVRADSECLFRALSNLIRNAKRYAEEEGPILITAERTGEEVKIRVADSGPGVPEEALDKIFAPFYRLDASRDRRSGGTGLGLAIVRSCIEACKGRVECRNRHPHGLEVTITLLSA
ncbi:MAG TPA: HAMP domain-containing sensor histidine kinase [Bryobacteraceae bacterium]|nr:HAMP domain-containing sensor histidine kinase [Bryobacteraceae bacterium]